MLDKVVERVRNLPKLVRIAVGIVLLIGGCVGFLPVLGFWMIPAGLIVLAIDVPFLRPYVDRVQAWLRDAEGWARKRLSATPRAKPKRRKPRGRARSRAKA